MVASVRDRVAPRSSNFRQSWGWRWGWFSVSRSRLEIEFHPGRQVILHRLGQSHPSSYVCAMDLDLDLVREESGGFGVFWSRAKCSSGGRGKGPLAPANDTMDDFLPESNRIVSDLG